MRHWLFDAGRRFGVSALIILMIGLLLPTASFAVGDHAVTFVENDYGSDPVVTSQTALVATPLTAFSSLNPAFSNPGFTFAGWSTSPSGGGITYSDGATYSFSVDITLYAQWSSPYKAVTFAENDSSGDNTAVQQTENTSTALKLFANLVPSFINPNHTFVSWNTSSTGGGITYSDGSTYSFSVDITLYAQWSVNVTPPPTTTTTTGVPTTTTTLVTTTTVNSGSSYVVTVSGGSGSGSGSPITSVPGLSIQLPSSDGLSKAGYVFSGWYSAASGGVFLGLAGASFTPTSSVSIYAQWTIAPAVKLHFSSNHGGGSVADVNGLEGATISLPSAKTLAYPRYQFTGWNTKSDASGISYAAGAKFVLSSTMTLFALWAPQRLSQGHSLLIGAIGPFAEGSSHLTGALKLQIRGIAVAIKSSGYAAASLYGYATGSGSASTNQQLSTNRALAVVGFLRSDLAAIHSKSVSTNAAGEGAIAGSTGAMFRRVEIFVR